MPANRKIRLASQSCHQTNSFLWENQEYLCAHVFVDNFDITLNQAVIGININVKIIENNIINWF